MRRRNTWAIVTLALGASWTAFGAPQRLGGPLGPGMRGRPFPGPGRKAPAAAARQNLAEQLMTLSPEEQREFMHDNPRFQKLPPQQQENIQRRLEEFNKLPPAQRETLRGRYELFRQLSPEQQERARTLYRKWNEQPVERRQELRRAIRHLRESTPEERKVRMESEQFRGRFSEGERELLRGLVELAPDRDGGPAEPRP